MTDAAAPAPPAWDAPRADTHRCDIATAVSVPDGIRLCFGAAALQAPDGQVARLLAACELSPTAAQHLLGQLRDVLASLEAARRGRHPGT